MSLGGGNSHPPSKDKNHKITNSLRTLRYTFVSHVKSSATSQRQILTWHETPLDRRHPRGLTWWDPRQDAHSLSPGKEPGEGGPVASQGQAVFSGAALDVRTSTVLPCLSIPPRGMWRWHLAAALATPWALWSQPCGTEAALYLLISILITTAGTGFIKGNISLSQNANYWKNITHFKDFFTFYDVGLTPIETLL